VTEDFERAVHAYAAQRVTAWDGRLCLPPKGAFNERSAIVPLPQLLAEIYPAGAGPSLATLTYGLCAFSDAVIWTDDVIDYSGADPLAARALPKVAVILAEAYRTFARVLGDAPVFWDALRRYFVDYVDALADETRIATGELPWGACSEQRALTIARGKNGLVRLVDAAVAALAGSEQRPGADEMLLAWFVGEQMLDDFSDWREDIRDGNISVLLRSVCETRPAADAIEAIGLRMYFEGHADRVLALAESQMNIAHAIACEVGAEQFAALVVRRREGIEPLRARIASAIASAC
jgi:hypothetical protein